MGTRTASSVVLSVLLCLSHCCAAETPGDGRPKPILYPATTPDPAQLASPSRLSDGAEAVIARMKDDQYALIPVTIENAPAHIPYGGRKIGKGNQLMVDANDFPTLARTGLHSAEELDGIERITGKPLTEIMAMGRPGTSSGEGFLAVDEDIRSVLQGDNRLVQRLGLTHPEMARPLFHIWNVILKEYELGRVGRYWKNIQYVLYNGRMVRFGEVHPTRGFQESIFNDEIQGAFDINLFRELDASERTFLRHKYPNLSKAQMEELIKKLSHIRTGEMEPCYVMRYGFYEGHTTYRVDPIAIAFLFGLRSIEEIEAAFPGELYEAFTVHFKSERKAAGENRR
ncbi:MAG: hypothetical protein KBE65_21710 [Phycisphaerae bacterium]|nr:hypothetical protein [Phycisphaerae bacterium]